MVADPSCGAFFGCMLVCLFVCLFVCFSLFFFFFLYFVGCFCCRCFCPYHILVPIYEIPTSASFFSFFSFFFVFLPPFCCSFRSLCFFYLKNVIQSIYIFPLLFLVFVSSLSTSFLPSLVFSLFFLSFFFFLEAVFTKEAFLVVSQLGTITVLQSPSCPELPFFLVRNTNDWSWKPTTMVGLTIHLFCFRRS